MYSVRQKILISDAIQKILKDINHPETQKPGEISFLLHVDGDESWSYAEIKNNDAVTDSAINIHNEMQDYDLGSSGGSIGNIDGLTDEQIDASFESIGGS